ncbi:hypothetical protein [Streptomyces sp. RerS4]|uniref:hypothetical protein n=1 Tax=Streptomyces sp. RerS4 TaxID=2942449 RepID=UPI00201BE9DD|nr:hypothetical protein [Streptomyces sp. RerS4]UQX04747.1 hypothetical protein M4D82_32735 [Streptomyces sp. RerS4]
MKILASSTLAVAVLFLAAVPASADDTPSGQKGAIGQGNSSAGSGTFGDTSDGHVSSHRTLMETGEPGAISNLVNNLTNPQPQ